MHTPLNRRQFIKSATATTAALAALPGVVQSTQAAPYVPVIPSQLLDALKSDDLVIKSDAARLLGQLGSPAALQPLVEYVRTDRHYSKTAGFEALMKLNDPSVVSDIRPLVDQPGVHFDHYWYGQVSVRVAAALALLHFGDESGRDLLLGEATPDMGHRDWALNTWFAPTALRLPDNCETTRQLKASLTVDKLLPEKKSDPGQITVICDSLGLVANEQAVDKLLKLLDHPSRYVRARAAVNLMAVSDQNAHIRKVSGMASDDATIFVRIQAAYALYGKQYTAHLAKITTAAEFASHAFDRATAVETLGRMARPEHIGVVTNALGESHPYNRLCAVEALDRIGTRAAVSTAIDAVSDANPRVQLHALKCAAGHRRVI